MLYSIRRCALCLEDYEIMSRTDAQDELQNSSDLITFVGKTVDIIIKVGFVEGS